MKKSRVSALAFIFLTPNAFAATFSWTPGNTDIVVNTDTLELTVDGITATARAFTAETNDTNTEADVVGPWPT